ncbi:transcription factor IIIC-gamma subunit [Heterostelium album PN500]|uniref:Transcription factor IIIC-gamma subunit n=1 Tax=Heterostelium pallidum (strain ATCC 26659 / Pp 5 / PN500) TaxID=670386 RepID=D3BTR2_HETP5|nr:transcription factor IIIC-gamma subunit [Heterostelium album PN500]EFA75098.1 transcription factor IIIC-gamma subunit [Heterostelium album PN500]|eukprot:XP_020427232.1 transcription factor IIIC-gamma subunit [Heterostelium album PN500]
MANICIKEITKHPVNDIPDIYYKLGSRLIELDHHEKALPLFLELLNKAENLEYEFIWLKLGTIYKALNNYQLAIKYLQDFIDAEPTNKEACLLLSDIYKETGDHEKSLQLLTQADNNNTSEDSEKGKFESTLNDLESKRLKATQQDIKELFKVADDFMNLSKYPQFLGISRALLNGSGDNVRLKKKTVLGGALTMRSVPRRIDRYIRHVSHRSNQPFAERLDEKDYFFLVTNTCKVLLLFHRYDEASTFLRYALRNIRFVTQAYSHQLNFLLVGIAFNVSRPLLAFSHFKYVCTKKPFSNRIWNLFNKVVLMSKGDYFFTHKDFIRKLLNENPTSLPMRIITGNSQKTTGNAKSALLEYLRAFKCQPEDPLVNLLISVTILCQSLGRKNPDRHKIVLTAFSFFYKYKMIRQNKELQEVYYNLGRAAHQLEDNPELASQLIKQYCTI